MDVNSETTVAFRFAHVSHVQLKLVMNPRRFVFQEKNQFSNFVDIAATALENVQQLNGQTVDRTVGEAQAQYEQDRELGWYRNEGEEGEEDEEMEWEETPEQMDALPILDPGQSPRPR